MEGKFCVFQLTSFSVLRIVQYGSLNLILPIYRLTFGILLSSTSVGSKYLQENIFNLYFASAKMNTTNAISLFLRLTFHAHFRSKYIDYYVT